MRVMSEPKWLDSRGLRRMNVRPSRLFTRDSDCAYMGGWKVRKRAGRHDYYTLKYGNRDSLVLLAALYADLESPCLSRKREKWRGFVRRNCAEGGI